MIPATAPPAGERPAPDDALRQSEERLRLVVEATGAGLWDVPVGGGEPYLSPRLEAILGYAPGTCPRTLRAFVRHIVPEHRGRVLERLRHSATRRSPFLVDCRIRDARGRARWLHLRGGIVAGPDGRSLRSVGSIVDVTTAAEAAEARVAHERELSRAELRRAEREAQLRTQAHRAQKLESLGLLAGGIAHDFNNLLVGVLSNASIALLDLEEASPLRDIVLDIERTAQRAADLTRQLLAYSGKGRFVVEALDLGALVREMAPLLHTVVSRDVTLHLEVDEALPPIEGDATQLRQVLMHLVTNASDALEGRAGTVTIRATGRPLSRLGDEALSYGVSCAGGETVTLEVEDTGIGMTRRVAERIFDPFFSTKFTGRGLGLAATLGIVRGHHGVIAVETAPGRGTRLRVQFPARRPVADEVVEAAAPDTAPPRQGHVLVVDDDEVVRGVTTALLQRQGFTVEAVGSGRAALDRLAQQDRPVRFALLDLTMPGLTGLEVLEAWRVEERTTGRTPLPVFLMSGYSAVDIAPDRDDLAITGFLQKPFTMGDLDVLLAALPAA